MAEDVTFKLSIYRRTIYAWKLGTENKQVIEKNTVFIIGAGASVPYDFPTGARLTNQVLEEAVDGGALFATLQSCDFSKDQIDKFRRYLEMSGRYSIDAFLEHRPEFLDIGKAAIAACLINRETKDSLRHSRDQHWYRYVLNKMVGRPDEYSRNAVTFLTFNYDRSLEHYAFNVLKHQFDLSDGEAANLLAETPIVHLHGKLGALPWQSESNAFVRTYEPHNTPSVILGAAGQIKIIHEDMLDRDTDFQVARTAISRAERLYFLGFGYDRKNMERLGLLSKFPSMLTDATCKGTSYGLRAEEEKEVARALRNRISMGRPMLGCENFLRELARLD